jgi:hypothetical protein
VIWTRLGRNVVTNLTTVTTSANDFNTLLLGIYFAQRLDAGAAQPEVFLRWEQVAAYSRIKYGIPGGPALRGVERVRRNLEGASRVDISAHSVDQILSDQKMYGLWGLYLGAARASGFIEEDAVRLTPAADAYVTSAFGDVLEHRTAIMNLVRQERSKLHLESKHSNLCVTVGKALSQIPQGLREPLWNALVANEHSSNVEQRQLAKLLEDPETLTDDEFSRAFVLRLQSAAQSHGYDELRRRIERIIACESVLAPASAALGFILSCNRLLVADIVDSLNEQWSDGSHIQLDVFRTLGEEIGTAVSSAEVNDLWQRAAACLRECNYDLLIRALVDINRLVMRSRGGAPWIEIKAERLEVNIPGEGSALPDKDALPELWRYPYFLHSIQSIAWQLKAG